MDGVFLYHLKSTARRLVGDDAVSAPPHLLAYRYSDDWGVILRVLHEAMGLPSHLAGHA